MEDKDDDAIEEFLDSIEEEDAEVSEDEVEEVETKTQEDYEKERFMKLKEENLLLTDKLICMDQKLMVLCRIMNIEKDNFEKEWDFSEETVFQQEESDGKLLTKDSFLTKMHALLIGKSFLGGKNPQEDSGCLATEDPKSAGILELKEVGESPWLKAAHDLEEFGKARDKVFEEIEFQKEQESDDLLLQIAEIEAEWNALIAGSAQAFARNTINSSDMEPVGVFGDNLQGCGGDCDRGGGMKGMINPHRHEGIFFAKTKEEVVAYGAVEPMNQFLSKVDDSFLDFLLRGSTRVRDFGEGDFALAESCVPIYRLSDEVIREDVYASDLIWRRLIRSVLEQSLAKLKSSQGLVVM